MTAPGPALEAQRVVSLPRIVGPAVAGLPHDGEGFIPVDTHARVQHLDGAYAAGDATTCPIKQGGVAAQQADAAAEAIAAELGAELEPQPFRPVLRGLLLTGATPRYLRAEVAGGRGDDWPVSESALWWPPDKIAGRYLAPYLATRGAETPPGSIEVRGRRRRRTMLEVGRFDAGAGAARRYAGASRSVGMEAITVVPSPGALTPRSARRRPSERARACRAGRTPRSLPRDRTRVRRRGP